RQKIPRIAYPQSADRVFAHIQDHDAVSALRLRNLHGNGLKSLCLIRVFKRGARLFDVLWSPTWSEERVNRLFDLNFAQMMCANDAVLLDEKRTGLRGRLDAETAVRGPAE